MLRFAPTALICLSVLVTFNAIANGEIIPHGHWPLDGNANNLVAGGADGEITNEESGGLGQDGSVWVESTLPGLGSRTVISFDGGAPTETAFVRAGDTPLMTLDNDFTWSFWSNTSEDISANPGQFAGIVGNRYVPGEGQVDYTPRQFIKFTPTAFEVHMDGAGVDNIDFGDNDLVRGEWVHQAVVKDGPSLTYYRDGVELLTGAYTVPLSEPMPLWLGGDDAGNATEQWHGLLSDVRTFTSALTSDEVRAMVPIPADLVFVGGTEIGALALSGPTENPEFGELVTVQGLSQFWYDAEMRGNVEGFLEAGDTGTDEYPLINPGGLPIITEDTWWRGSNDNVLSDIDLENYPAALAGTRFEGSTNEDNYSVRLTGEIFIPNDGEYLIRDGIDDFAMIAIDIDGNGELDALDEITSDDVGTIDQNSLGDIHVLDDDWATFAGGGQDISYHGLADITDISPDGEWRKIEIWTSEGGGGDGGIVYMGDVADADIFDDRETGDLSQEERDRFVIQPENLRTETAELTGGETQVSLRTDVEYIMQVGPEGGDQIVVSDSGGVLTTTLDVTDATIRIEALDGLVDGQSFTLFDADNISGIDSASFDFEDPSLWDLTNLAAGEITFGTTIGLCDPNSQGDLDGSGSVEFADFLVLSSNFGNEVTSHTQGDIDCNGAVEFADFLVLSSNFGNSVARTSSVPEPSGWVLLLLGIIAMRPRKRCS